MTEVQKQFNKGKALLWAILITFGIFIPVGILRYVGINALAIQIILGIIAYMYAKRLKVTSEKGLSWGPAGYFIFIALLGEIGVLVFCYDIQKVKAKRNGMNVDTKKGTLFIVLLLLLLLPILSAFVIGGISGYKNAMLDYQQQGRLK